MPTPNRLTYEHLEKLPYGPRLLREADLVLAANIHSSLVTNSTLYEDEISYRVAEFCHPLDLDVQRKFLGVIRIQANDGETQYQALERHLSTLATNPRGHWAIYEQDGKYDAYISNGVGGTNTASGHKFKHTSPEAADLSFNVLYGTIYSHLVYHRRSEIERSIIQASVEAANIALGHRIRNRRYLGKIWSNIVYVGSKPNHYVGGRVGHLIRMSRRGVKTEERILGDHEFFRLMDIPCKMPADLCDPGNTARMRSLSEERRDKAQALWDQLTNPSSTIVERMKVIQKFDQADATEFSQYGCKAGFHHRGDQLTRIAYTGNREDADAPTYLYTVNFEPGSDTIASCSITAPEPITNETETLVRRLLTENERLQLIAIHERLRCVQQFPEGPGREAQAALREALDGALSIASGSLELAPTVLRQAGDRARKAKLLL